MDADRKDELRLTAKRLREEAHELLEKAKAIVGQSAELTEGKPWPFTAECPDGHPSEQTQYDHLALSRLLRYGEPIALRCRQCGREWDASEGQRTVLDWALRNAQS